MPLARAMTAALLAESTHPATVRLCVNPRHAIAAKWEATLHWGSVAGAPELVCDQCRLYIDFVTTRVLTEPITLTLVLL